MAVGTKERKKKQKAVSSFQEDCGKMEDDSTIQETSTEPAKNKKDNKVSPAVSEMMTEVAENSVTSELTGETNKRRKRRKKRKAPEEDSDNNDHSSVQEASGESPKKKKKKSELPLESQTTNESTGDTAGEMTNEIEKRKKKKKEKKEKKAQQGSPSIKNTSGESPKKKKKKKKKGKPVQEAIVRDKTRSQLAVEYLKQWKEDRTNWKFMKVQQIWMANNILTGQQIPDEVFPIWLQYMDASSMGQKKFIMKKATEITEKHEKNDGEVSADDLSKYKRARMIIQTFTVDDDDDDDDAAT